MDSRERTWVWGWDKAKDQKRDRSSSGTGSGVKIHTSPGEMGPPGRSCCRPLHLHPGSPAIVQASVLFYQDPVTQCQLCPRK